MKTILKAILHRLAYALGVVQLFAFLNRKKAIVLMYHGVRAGEGIPGRLQLDVPVGVFRRQMAYLAAHRNVVPFSTLIQWLRAGHDIPDYTVVITLDDGYRNNYTQAYPILRRYRLPATIFLTTGFIGTDRALWPDRLAYAIFNTTRLELALNDTHYPLSTNRARSHAYRELLAQAMKLDNAQKDHLIESVIERLGTDLNALQHDGDWAFLTWSQVCEMRRDNIAFGAHTENHIILTRVSPEEAEAELRCSKEVLEEQIGEEITLFCYPHGHVGDFSNRTRQMVQDAGFQGALLALPGLVAPGDDPFALRRIGVSGDESFCHFAASLSGLRLVSSPLKRRVQRAQEHIKGRLMWVLG
jgi:peptidoglycan/xylan/chitin deacetylase (PgdA/CDA1 family)